MATSRSGARGGNPPPGGLSTPGREPIGGSLEQDQAFVENPDGR